MNRSCFSDPAGTMRFIVDAPGCQRKPGKLQTTLLILIFRNRVSRRAEK